MVKEEKAQGRYGWSHLIPRCPLNLFKTWTPLGGSLETAAHIAAHESPRTTKHYDRTADNITLEEIERIRF